MAVNWLVLGMSCEGVIWHSRSVIWKKDEGEGEKKPSTSGGEAVWGK